MKKFALLAMLVLSMAVVFTGCPAQTVSFRVGLVTDIGGIDDKSFNQGTWEGIKKFGAEKLLKADEGYKFLQSTADADYIPNLKVFADQKLDLIVAPGYLFGNAMTEVAKDYPDQKFLIIDYVVDAPNVASAVFAEHEGSFLVGVAAGLKAKADGKTVVGFIGGMEGPLIGKFQAGFQAGVAAVYPECQVLIDYAGDFGKPELGQTLAQKQYNAGAYIIFQAAGGTGNGVIKEAKERSSKGDICWAIGVDKDQYADGIYEGEKSAILTSMMKRVDTAAYDIANQAMAGKFTAGVTLYNIANSGVSIPLVNPNLTPEIVAEVAKYSEQIKAGTLVVSEVPAAK